MIPSQKCVDLVKRFESCRLSAYSDPVGIPTIGYGHTANVHLGQSIDLEQADAFLEVDLADAADRVEFSCGLTVVPNQNQFDALVSFEFNTGGLKGSTLVKCWNAGFVLDAANQFLVWNKAHVNGQLVVLSGLTARRNAERALFLGV